MPAAPLRDFLISLIDAIEPTYCRLGSFFVLSISVGLSVGD